ncbi:MAG: pro-sigmaK processing inhibitor BofA [Clostridiales bacterium]|nr:pro-sigmaK processing inhibitor BofA [Clostridiales bacterium]
MGIEVIFAYIFGIIMLFLVAKLLLIPVKIVWKLAINAIIGGITLLLINFLGGFFGLYIPINIITALITGILGVPGVVMILILQYIL